MSQNEFSFSLSLYLQITLFASFILLRCFVPSPFLPSPTRDRNLKRFDWRCTDAVVSMDVVVKATATDGRRDRLSVAKASVSMESGESIVDRNAVKPRDRIPDESLRQTRYDGLKRGREGEGQRGGARVREKYSPLPTH